MIKYKPNHAPGLVKAPFHWGGSLLCAALSVTTVQAQTPNADTQAATYSQQHTEPVALKTLFQNAKALYDQKAFEQAYPLFDQLVQKAPQSRTFNFYLGRSAFETQRFDAAMAAFDRVLMLEPNHLRTRLEMARVYFALKQFDMAAMEVQAVLASSEDLPPAVKQNAERFAQRIQAEMNYSPHSHQFTLVLGGEYDSNVNNDLGGSGSFELPGLDGVTLDKRDEVEDYALSQTLLYEHDYDLGGRGGWHWQTTALGLNKNHREAPENDLQYVSLETGPGLRQARGRWSFPLTVDRVYLDGETYVSNLSLGVEYEHSLESKVLLTAGYTGRISEYESDNEARNARSHIVDLSAKKFWGDETPWALGVEARGESRTQRETHPTDPASMKEYTLRASLSKVIDDHWRVDSGLMRRWSDYDYESALFENQRSDRINRFSLGVSYKVNASSLLSLTASRAIHDSNQGIYHYDKDRAALRYILQF
ncbi:tetratricopeptide repeat protein [Hydrogenovibrio halophilus]|uniref:tetratricopeptide repeat protein n=1 Tax=Hydrogenovibrio halophilus TaxID=373391 RepID=UPI00036EAFBD|nr:tetratricopeptide repeat protein [Hydrogenovibrio halophilus]